MKLCCPRVGWNTSMMSQIGVTPVPNSSMRKAGSNIGERADEVGTWPLLTRGTLECQPKTIHFRRMPDEVKRYHLDHYLLDHCLLLRFRLVRYHRHQHCHQDRVRFTQRINTCHGPKLHLIWHQSKQLKILWILIVVVVSLSWEVCGRCLMQPCLSWAQNCKIRYQTRPFLKVGRILLIPIPRLPNVCRLTIMCIIFFSSL